MQVLKSPLLLKLETPRCGTQLKPSPKADSRIARSCLLGVHHASLRRMHHTRLEILVDAEPIRTLGGEHVLERSAGLGEHNEYVLRDLLGLSMEEFDQLVIEGIVN